MWWEKCRQKQSLITLATKTGANYETQVPIIFDEYFKGNSDYAATVKFVWYIHLRPAHQHLMSQSYDDVSELKIKIEALSNMGHYWEDWIHIECFHTDADNTSYLVQRYAMWEQNWSHWSLCWRDMMNIILFCLLKIIFVWFKTIFFHVSSLQIQMG